MINSYLANKKNEEENMLRIENLIKALPTATYTGYMSITNISQASWKNYFSKPLDVDILGELLYLIAIDMHEVAAQKVEEGEMYSYLQKGKELLDKLADIGKSFGLVIDKYHNKIIFCALLGEQPFRIDNIQWHR